MRKLFVRAVPRRCSAASPLLAGVRLCSRNDGGVSAPPSSEAPTVNPVAPAATEPLPAAAPAAPTVSPAVAGSPPTGVLDSTVAAAASGGQNMVHAGFDQWCQEEGMHDLCATEFIRGAVQAYRTLGAILGSKFPLTTAKEPAATKNQKFQNLSRDVLFDNNSRNGALPFTQSFCDFLNHYLVSHGSTVNIYHLAGPNDVVSSASLSKFVVSDILATSRDEAPPLDERDFPSSKKADDDDDDAAAPLSPTWSPRVTVVVTMYVIVPPQRFFPSFNFFHDRISGAESEYERVAVARLFAASGVGWPARFFDGLVRAVSGANAEFLYTKALGSMLGIPDNIDQCPPCKKKNLTFHLSHDRKRWLLASIDNMQEAQGKPYPDPSGLAGTVM